MECKVLFVKKDDPSIEKISGYKGSTYSSILKQCTTRFDPREYFISSIVNVDRSKGFDVHEIDLSLEENQTIKMNIEKLGYSIYKK